MRESGTKPTPVRPSWEMIQLACQPSMRRDTGESGTFSNARDKSLKKLLLELFKFKAQFLPRRI